VKEGEYPPPPVAVRPGFFFAVKTYFKNGLGNSYYLWYFAATVLGGLSALPFNLYSILYAKSVGMDTGTYFKCLGLTYFCSFFLSYPLGILADRFHPLRVSIVGLAVYALVMVGCGSLVRDVMTFGIALVIHGVTSGSVTTAFQSLPQRLLPRDKFAEIGSVGGLIGAITGMIGTPFIGRFLDSVHHDYRYTFYMSADITALAVGAFIILHGRFMGLGGLKNYVPPE
jgi:sugar phosphate permease